MGGTGVSGIEGGVGRTRRTCPRCDYDLQGIPAAWGDTCPLDGTCPECGLDFPWAEIHGARGHGPRWCVEFAPRRRLGRATILTFLRSLAPWKFWRRLGMAHDMRGRRVLAYGLIWVAILATMYAALQAAAALLAYRSVVAEIAAIQANLPRSIAFVQQRRDADTEAPPAVRDARRRAYDDVIERTRARMTTPDVIEISPARAVLEQVVLPIARTSSGQIRSTESVRPYPAPREVYARAATWLKFGAAGSRFNLSPWAPTVFVVVWAPGFAICVPLTFVLLPITRRRAKVRWRHLARIAAYGAFVPVGYVTLVALVASRLPPAPWSWPLGLVVAFGLILQWAWWSCAVRAYLRLPHARSVATLLVALAALVPAAVMQMVMG